MKSDNIILLGCLMNHQGVMDRAVKRYMMYPLFDRLLYPAEAFIWETLKETYKIMKGRLPTEIVLLTQLDERLRREPACAGIRMEVLKILDWILKLPKEQFSEAVGHTYLEATFVQLSKLTWMDSIRTMRSMSDMTSAAHRIARELTDMSTPSNEVRILKPMLDLGRFLTQQSRRLLGIPFWDERGGSYAPGEAIGLLGPSGGGKTVLAISVLCEQVKMGNHCMYVTYEQPAEGDIMQRVATHMTGLPISRFRDTAYDSLDDEAKSLLRTAVQRMGDRLQIVDFATGELGAGGPDELIEHLRHAVDKGEGPNIFILDWFGEMVDRYAHAQGGNLDNRYRNYGNKFLGQILDFIRRPETNMAGLIMHQLTSSVGQQGAEHKPSRYDAYEMKNFCHKFTSVSCLGRMDDRDKWCWFVPDKSRLRGAEPVKIQLIGEHQRFQVWQEHSYRSRTGGTTDYHVPDEEELARIRRKASEQ